MALNLRAGACPSEGVGAPNGSMDEFWLHDPLPFAQKIPKISPLTGLQNFKFSSAGRVV
jgi:hypothetical protein